MNEKLMLANIKQLKKELEAERKLRAEWERRARYLEAKRVEGLAPPYKFGGEGVA